MLRVASLCFLLLAPTALAQNGGYLATGWEDGQPPGVADTVLMSRDVAPGPGAGGLECSRRAGERQRSGAVSLMVSGQATAGYAYCYYRLFDDDLRVVAGTKLRYWIYHSGSAKVAIDGVFTDGSTLRDGGFVDQNGVRLHPGARNDPLGVWHFVEVDLSAAAGKTLDVLMVGFDNGGDGFTGAYRAYIDDLQVGDEPGVRVHLAAWNGMYVAAEGGGGSAVNANRAGAGVWETFTLLDRNGGGLAHGDPVRLKAHDGRHHVRASGGLLDARATVGGATETFTLERIAGAGSVRDGETIALRASDGRYVVAELGGGSVVNANRAGVGPWETFRLQVAAGSRLTNHPSPLVGRLRIEGGMFRDDTGPVLPIFCHFGEAFSRYTRDRDAVRRQLDAIAQAGYHGIRFWTVLSAHPRTLFYWAGRDVNETVTPDYWGQLRDFLRELESRQLRGVISQGGLYPEDIPDRVGFANRLADILDQTGTANVVAIIEGGNEAWQTGESDPAALARFLTPIKQRHPAALYTLTSPPGETKDELDRYSIGPADLFDVHGYRGGHWWDKVRHIFSIAYEGLPMKRLGWQGEPTGPGGAVSVTDNKQELDDDTLAALAAMSLMSRQAWCYMSGPGVQFDSPIDAQPGFWSVPRVRDALPADVMGFQRLIHGGQRWANERIFESIGDTRCDHALSDDGRFVVIIYGPQLTYNQVRNVTIERVTDLGRGTRIIVGRR